MSDADPVLTVVMRRNLEGAFRAFLARHRLHLTSIPDGPPHTYIVVPEPGGPADQPAEAVHEGVVARDGLAPRFTG